MYIKVSLKYEVQTFQEKKNTAAGLQKATGVCKPKVNLTLYSPLGLQEVEVT
jgi:hypothetical protein